MARQRNSLPFNAAQGRSLKVSPRSLPIAQQPPMELDSFTTQDISSITPESLSSISLLSGKIAIKWPFSSFSQKLTFLLADPCPRRRLQGGQIKITLLGEAAQHLDQIDIEEEISIAPPQNTTPVIESCELDTTGPLRVKFHIIFPQGCILLVLLPSHC